MPENKDKIKVVENSWKEDLPFPELLNYENLLYTPQKLEDINKGEGDRFNLAINDLGQARNFADFSITETKLANLAVATRAIQDDAVTAAKVWKGGAVITLSAQIGTAVVQDAHIANLSAVKITGQVVNAQIANIDFAKISNVVITNAHIVDLNADKINAGTLTGRRIQTHVSFNRGIKMEVTSHGAIADAHIDFWDNAGNSTILYIQNTDASFNIEGGDLVVQANIRTPTSGATLGTAAQRWTDLHLSRDCYVGRQIYLTPRIDAFAVKGTIMFLSTTNRLMVHDGTAWRTVSWT